MNRLFQFIRKLLIAVLAGVFISISMFPGEVIAVADSLESLTQNKASLNINQVDFEQFRLGLVGAAENCPLPQQEAYENPPYAYAYSSKTEKEQPITLTATSGSFTFDNNNTNAEKFEGRLYEGTYYDQDGNEKTFEPTYTPPTIRVSPGKSIDLTLTNNLPIDDVKVSGLPLVEENLEKVSQDTNLHYHGFNVSPLLGSDDVVMHVHSNITPDSISPPSTSDKGGYYHWVDTSKKDHISKDFPPITEYQMQVDIPEEHQSGLFWYHPHVHTVSEPQVLGGMSGGIIIEGIADSYTILRGIPLADKTTPTPPLTEQVMLFKDFTNYFGDSKDKYNCFTLNGLVKPNMTIKPGEVQFWRIGNIGADQFLNLQLFNLATKLPVPLYIFARDSSVVTTPQETKEPILVPPAGRVELLVVGDQAETTYELVSQPLDLDNYSYDTAQYHLATVKTEGTAVEYDTEGKTLDDYITSQEPKKPIDKILPDPVDLAGYPDCDQGKSHSKCIAKKRTFTFLRTKIDSTDKNSPFVFAMANGKYPDPERKVKPQLYDENRIDTTSNLGDIEEWTLINYDDKPSHHAFHIHQLDFVVTHQDPNYLSEQTPIIGYRDTIDLPPKSTTVVRISFVNPFITGVFVYHCHILGHEDRGMMMNLKVIDPNSYQPAFKIKS